MRMRHAGLKARMLLVGSILFAFYALLAGIAFAMGYGLAPVLAGSVLFVGFQYILGKKLALRSAGAEDLPENKNPEIHRMVETLSRDMGIEKPRLMTAQMGVPNAFAVGRRGAGVVVLSDELVQLLDRSELKGVIAHELAHISNRDVVLMVLGQSIASMVGIATYWLVAFSDDSFASIIVGWVLSSITQMLVTVFVLAISRYREYVADSDAADYTGNPTALASALTKISDVGQRRDAQMEDSVNALCIFSGERGMLATLFATHPPTEERIERLDASQLR